MGAIRGGPVWQRQNAADLEELLLFTGRLPAGVMFLNARAANCVR
jgi:hypothetical protein